MKKILLFSAGIGLLGFVIYRYIVVQTALLKDFTYSIIGFQIQQMSASQVAFTLKIRFTNKSSIEATVSSLYADVLLNGNNVGYIVESKQFIIPAKASSDIDLYFAFQPQAILGSAVDLILGVFNKKSIPLSIKGTAKISSSFITTTIPIEYDTEVNI